MTDKEMTRNGWNMGSFLSGFLIGGLMGAATTLLMAPQSGEETRTMIRDTGLELRDKGAEAKDNVVNTAEETRAQAEQAITDMRTRMAGAVDEASGRVEDLAHTVRQRTEEIARHGREKI